MTTLDALKGINSYPIPLRTLNEVAERRGLDLDETATIEMIQSRGYNLAYADLLMWLSFAPQVTQGGQSYSFTDDQRMRMRNRASDIYEDYEESNTGKGRYGYKGSRL